MRFLTWAVIGGLSGVVATLSEPGWCADQPSAVKQNTNSPVVINLNEIRFAFCNAGHLFGELGDKYEDLCGWLFESGRVRATEQGFMRDDLPTQVQEAVMGQIAEKVGDEYSVLLPASCSLLSVRLAGVTLYPEIGGFTGIIGVFDGSAESSWKTSDCDGSRLYALLMRGTRPSMPKPMPDWKSDSKDVAALQTIGREVPGLSGASIVHVRAAYCRYPDVKGAVVVMRDSSGKQEYLLVMVERAHAWEVIPVENIWLRMSAIPGWHDRVFPIPDVPYRQTCGYSVLFRDIADVASGTFMQNPEYYVFPDLDNNGGSEILLVSDTMAFLFAIEVTENGTYVLREVHEVRFDS